MKKVKHFYVFGDFRIDTGERLLFFNDKQLHITPKAFDTLLILVQNNGHVVEKHELMKALWPDTFVEEANLSHNISLLRKAFAASSTGEQYIQTVPRRGYRFTANVKELRQNDAKEHNDVENITAKAQGIMSGSIAVTEPEQKVHPQKIWKTSLIVGIFLLLLITVGLAAWKYRQATTSQAPEIHSIISISPAIAGKQFYIQIKGRGIDPNTARVVVIGLGCQDFGMCNVPNNVLHWYGNVMESQIERVPLTLAPGYFQIFVQNGPEGGISNALPLTVKLE